MNEHDLNVFLDIATNYFEKMTCEPAVLQSPTIQFAKRTLLDYTGLISISGNTRGCVYVTMSEGMVRSLLTAIGESEQHEATFCDAVGEVANTISSNARNHFGPNFAISIPVAVSQEKSGELALPFSTFVLPIEWRQQQGYIVIGLESQTVSNS